MVAQKVVCRVEGCVVVGLKALQGRHKNNYQGAYRAVSSIQRVHPKRPKGATCTPILLRRDPRLGPGVIQTPLKHSSLASAYPGARE